MNYLTKIYKMIGPDDPKHLLQFEELLPNIFVGMCIWIKGEKYQVKDIRTNAAEDICWQIIEVE